MLQTEHFIIEPKENGLISFRLPNGLEIIDRGALHEVIDLHHDFPDEDEQRDGYRNVHHYLGGFAPADKVVTQKNRIIIRGEAATSEGKTGAQWYQTIITLERGGRVARLRLKRRYLRDIKTSGDTSICFLSPGSFAQHFAVGANDAMYINSRGEEARQAGRWDSIEVKRGIARSEIPVRLRVGFKDHGWGALLNKDNIGFGLIVLAFSGTHPGEQHGEIRATRPRDSKESPASIKFDEIEFQWMPGSPRPAGTVEEAVLILFPCTSPEEAQKMYFRYTGKK